MIYRRGQKVLVQGITGKQGTFWTEKMKECGTDVVAANGAVFVMIGALAIIFLGIMAVLYSFVRRARRTASASAPVN